ncbi:MAG TPA: ABC transporter ATP-binding protein [Solirubrobacteraceae bacterium]|nr:ABC transporter ATP-binding protein [Solirubrobacteraceae bacterium]HUA04468.1 ABC transporter ATP-binding protein [Solirubrobacteraceae bacterium]
MSSGNHGFAASHGAGGSGAMRSLRGPSKKPPPLMDPTRERDTARILALFKPYRFRLAAVLVLIVVSAGIAILQPFLLRRALDVGILQHDETVLTVTVLAMIAISIFTNATSVWQTYMSNVVGQRVMHDLRAAVYQHLQKMSLAFFTRTRTGEVQSRIANDIGGLDSVVTTTATTIAQNATTVIASLVAMCLLDWRLAIISLIFVPPSVWMTRRVGQMRRRITTEQQRQLADMSALVAESLSVSGIMLGKTMGRGADLADRFTGESKDIADLEVRSRMAGRWMMATIQFTFAVQPAIIYWLAGQTFIGSTISIGTVVAFTTLQTRLLFPIQSLLSVQADMQTSLALFDRIFEYLDLPVDIVEKEHPVELRPSELLGEVRFEDVSFRYSDQTSSSADAELAGESANADSPWTLRDIDLVVPAGTRTAVVGETGAGKTTIGYLVARLYEPQEGRVTIDGVDVRDASLASLAATVGVVSQETYLFHASVRENLRFARPNATDEEIEEAARTARIHNLIASLPDGYETIVGERGYRFSGGEKQRMAIARTVLRNPPVLVLDEATSSLDTQTEAAVQAELERLAEGRTTITIAHRLSTVRDADQIVVLDRGRIVERGSHDELMERRGAYAALVARDVTDVIDEIAGDGIVGGAS